MNISADVSTRADTPLSDVQWINHVTNTGHSAPSVDPELSSVDSKSPQIDPDPAQRPVSQCPSGRSITVAGSFCTLTVGEWTQPASVFSLLQA